MMPTPMGPGIYFNGQPSIAFCGPVAEALYELVAATSAYVADKRRLGSARPIEDHVILRQELACDKFCDALECALESEVLS